ncbi:MAG: hypothetical protein H6R19_795 [Proteobacteria bacterium]|nr:hypothetical protein [Pseudomonadota bacterium]
MHAASSVADAPRLILCHKHKTSARLRFLCFPHGMLAFEPLPADCTINPDSSATQVRVHPAAWVRQAAERLEMDLHLLCAEGDFHAEARLGPTCIPILLACFTSIDPPFEIALRYGARFIPITETQHASPQELTLLRLAYEHLIG